MKLMINCLILFYSWFITGNGRDCKKQIILIFLQRFHWKRFPLKFVRVFVVHPNSKALQNGIATLFQVWVELPTQMSSFWQIWSGSCQSFTICCQSVRPNKNYFVKMCRNSTTCKNLKWSACVVYKILLPTICWLRPIQNSFQNISTKCI